MPYWQNALLAECLIAILPTNDKNLFDQEIMMEYIVVLTVC